MSLQRRLLLGRQAGGLCIECGDARFQGGKLLARAGEEFALYFEFLAGDEVEAREQPVEECARVLVQVVGRAGGGKFGQPGGEIVEDFWVQHGEGLEMTSSQFTARQEALHQHSADGRNHATTWCAGYSVGSAQEFNTLLLNENMFWHG